MNGYGCCIFLAYLGFICSCCLVYMFVTESVKKYLALIIVLLSPIAFYVYLYLNATVPNIDLFSYLFSIAPTSESPLKIHSDIGQAFGILNTLFSGLAFVAVYWTFATQREQLKAQKDELQIQLAESKIKILKDKIAFLDKMAAEQWKSSFDGFLQSFKDELDSFAKDEASHGTFTGDSYMSTFLIKRVPQLNDKFLRDLKVYSTILTECLKIDDALKKNENSTDSSKYVLTTWYYESLLLHKDRVVVMFLYIFVFSRYTKYSNQHPLSQLESLFINSALFEYTFSEYHNYLQDNLGRIMISFFNRGWFNSRRPSLPLVYDGLSEYDLEKLASDQSDQSDIKERKFSHS